jgi:two-component system, NtrC family, sensor histidine kinase KinB
MKFPFGRKILLGYGIIILLLIGIIGLAAHYISRLESASQAILRDNYERILAAENMLEAIEQQDGSMILHLLFKTDETLDQFRENEGVFYQWLVRAKDRFTIADEVAILNRIEKGYARFLTLFLQFEMRYGEIADDVSAGVIPDNQDELLIPRQAARFYRDEMYTQLLTIRNDCLALREMNQNRMYQAIAAAHRLASRSVLSMLIIGVVVISFGLAFSRIVTRIVVRPVNLLTNAAVKVSEGDLEVTIPENGQDEIGMLASRFNNMVKKVKAFQEINLSQVISEKKKLEAIVLSLSEGIIVCDAQMRVTAINPVAEQIFQVREPDALNKPFLEVLQQIEVKQKSQSVETLFEYLREVSQTWNMPSIHEDIITLDVGGVDKHYQFSITPIKSENARPYGVVVLLQDITKLKELDQMKSEFIMLASHELRTPLTSLAMSVGLLLDETAGEINDKQRTLLQVAHEELNRLKRLVNELLELEKIERGKLELDFEAVEIHGLCVKALNVMKPQAQAKEISLSIECGIPDVRVHADAGKTMLVIMNLLDNAVRYTDSGGWVKLKLEVGGDWVFVSVQDNGPGIPAEDQSKIFDKFVQLATDNAGGAGLGLTIAKEITHAHGGAIWVESEVEAGSTFTFTLPMFYQA